MASGTDGSGLATAAEQKNFRLDNSLRDYLETNSDVVTVIRKPVPEKLVGALSAKSERPILFENIVEHPGYRVLDILLKHRDLQARALGVSEDDYLKTLAYRLRQPARGFKTVDDGPVREVVITGDDVDLTKLPILKHSAQDAPALGTMVFMRDPDTGFHNTMHCYTTVTGRNTGNGLFLTPHCVQILQKWMDRGADEMPIAYVIGVPPACEIMANFSGLHMDIWGEADMFGTIMDQDFETVRCETIDLEVPAHAEIVLEGVVKLNQRELQSGGPTPLMYRIPRESLQPAVNFTAITMRKEKPIYRNYQTTPQTDHQVIPRLCHEAVLYNRLTEMGVPVKDIRFPTFGGAMSCILQLAEVPRDGMINDALMMMMSCPWNNAKMSVAISADTDISSAAAVYHAIATRCDPGRDMFTVDRTRGSLWDPSAKPIPDDPMRHRVVGKVGIDATIKSRHDENDFELAWPEGWDEAHLEDYLD
jgi:2,5-furandicarboxylate decarboxylase 1